MNYMKKNFTPVDLLQSDLYYYGVPVDITALWTVRIWDLLTPAEQQKYYDATYDFNVQVSRGIQRAPPVLMLWGEAMALAILWYKGDITLWPQLSSYLQRTDALQTFITIWAERSSVQLSSPPVYINEETRKGQAPVIMTHEYGHSTPRHQWINARQQAMHTLATAIDSHRCRTQDMRDLCDRTKLETPLHHPQVNSTDMKVRYSITNAPGMIQPAAAVTIPIQTIQLLDPQEQLPLPPLHLFQEQNQAQHTASPVTTRENQNTPDDSLNPLIGTHPKQTHLGNGTAPSTSSNTSASSMSTANTHSLTPTWDITTDAATITIKDEAEANDILMKFNKQLVDKHGHTCDNWQKKHPNLLFQSDGSDIPELSDVFKALNAEPTVEEYIGSLDDIQLDITQDTPTSPMQDFESYMDTPIPSPAEDFQNIPIVNTYLDSLEIKQPNGTTDKLPLPLNISNTPRTQLRYSLGSDINALQYTLSGLHSTNTATHTTIRPDLSLILGDFYTKTSSNSVDTPLQVGQHILHIPYQAN
jgi:hypothetical protein